MGYPNVRIRQMKANFFYIVHALVHVKVGLGIAPVQIESLERGPWSELRGQVPANLVSGKTEYAPDASKNMHLHFTIRLAAAPLCLPLAAAAAGDEGKTLQRCAGPLAQTESNQQP